MSHKKKKIEKGNNEKNNKKIRITCTNFIRYGGKERNTVVQLTISLKDMIGEPK